MDSQKVANGPVRGRTFKNDFSRPQTAKIFVDSKKSLNGPVRGRGEKNGFSRKPLNGPELGRCLENSKNCFCRLHDVWTYRKLALNHSYVMVQFGESPIF